MLSHRLPGVVSRLLAVPSARIWLAAWLVVLAGGPHHASAQEPGQSGASADDSESRPLVIRIRQSASARPWTTTDASRASRRLQAATRRRSGIADGFSVEVVVHGRVARFTSPVEALAACTAIHQWTQAGRDLKHFLPPNSAAAGDGQQSPPDEKTDGRSYEYPRATGGRRQKAFDGADGLDSGPAITGGLGGVGGGYAIMAAAPLDDADAAPQRVALKSRLIFRDFQQATFSFEHARRDDPTGVCANDWDLQYGNGGEYFNVVMVADDRSVMADLGKAAWEEIDLKQLTRLAPLPLPQRLKTPVNEGHMYLVHTLDRDSDLYALFRVESVRGGVCEITWKRIAAPQER